jgi:hypothetical protein
VTLFQFVVPLGMALFFVTMIFLYGDLGTGLLRLEVAGIFLLATIGGWGMGEWMHDRKQSVDSDQSGS